jgi:predicted SAM-dependent methyltransferase
VYVPEQTLVSSPDLHQVKQTWSPYDRLPKGLRAALRNRWQRLGLNPGTASALRYEFDMFLLRTRCALSGRHRQQLRELAARQDLLVHLGCGNALLPRWINLDCYPPERREQIEVLTVDMRRGLPFVDGSVAAVFTEHFLEHLPMPVVASVILPEVARILRPGGRIRIGVPNGEYFIDKYIEYRAGGSDPLFDRNRVPSTPMAMLNEIAHGYGHHFLYDFDTLKHLSQEAGLSQVTRCQPGVTSEPVFAGKDRADEWREAMSLYVEAVKPG